MRRTIFRGPGRAAEGRPRRGWEDGFDPALAHYYDPEENYYNTGPGANLAAEHQPYNIRHSRLPVKIFISKIHPHTTEEGIANILYNYGNPISVYRLRNKYNEPIAYAEFETQREADNAIIGLNGRPPLNWSVTCYRESNREIDLDAYLQQVSTDLFLDEIQRADLDRQVPLYPLPPSQIRPQPRFSNPVESSVELHPPISVVRRNLADMDCQTCIVCRKHAEHICTVCKTRYCSRDCQEADWPMHRINCQPPPPLQQVSTTVGTKSFPLQLCGAPQEQNVQRVDRDLVSVQSSAIKGIEPLDRIQRNLESREDHGRERTINASTGCGLNGYGERSPNWKTEDALIPSRSSLLGSPPPNNRSVVSSGGPNDRNLPIKNYVSNTPVTSPPKNSTSLPVKVYATLYPGHTFKPNTLNPEVVVCFSKSPHEFYIQYKCYDNMLIKMTEAIQQSAPSAAPLTNPQELAPCLAHFTDGMWYRARVVKVTEKGVGVLFVDFGNTGFVESSTPVDQTLRQLEYGLAQNPFFAFRFKLADVEPLNGSNWDEDVNAKFQELVMGKLFLMETVSVKEDIISVRLKSQEGIDLSRLLVATHLAKDSSRADRVSDELDPIPPANKNTLPVLLPPAMVQRPPPPQAPIGRKNATQFPNKISSTSSLATVQRSPETSVDKMTIPKPGQHTIPFQAATSTSPAAPLPRTVTSAGPAAPLPRTVTSTIPAAPLPQTATSTGPAASSPQTNAAPVQTRAPQVSRVAALIRHTTQVVSETPPMGHSIVGVLKSGQIVIFSGVVAWNSGQVVGTLIRGDEDLATLDFDSVIKTAPPTSNFSPSVGSLAAALSPELGQWYRSYITNVAGSTYTVLYIDYGNVEKEVVSVKPIPADYQLRELAVKLTICGNVTADIEMFAEQNLGIDNPCQLEILSNEKDGTILAKFADMGAPNCSVRLEPWTSLVQSNSPIETQPTLMPSMALPQRKIECRALEAGFAGEVMVCLAEDVDKIFVQLVDEKVLESSGLIQELLNEDFPTSSMLQVVPSVGSYVASIFPDDGMIYRARVSEVSGNALTLQYIDYGNSATVPLSDVRPLPDSLYEYPANCHQISLGCVSRPSGPLPPAVQSLLNSYVNEVCTMLVLPSTANGATVECTLTNNGKVLNELINELLEVHGRQGTTAGAVAPVAPPKEVVPTSTMPQLETVAPVVPADNTLIKTFYNSGPFLALPEGKTFKARVLTSGDPQSIMLSCSDEDTQAKLMQLNLDIKNYMEESCSSWGHSPEEGEICLVRSEESGLWCRAACLQVEEIPGCNRYTLLSVDFGKWSVATVDDIRRIPKRFYECLPFLAQQSILKGCENMENVPPNLVARVAQLLPEGSIVDVSVVSRGQLDEFIVDIPAVIATLSQESLI